MWFCSQLVHRSSLTYHLAPSVLNVTITYHPFILPLVVFPKVLFSALLFVIMPCTLPVSVTIYSLSLDPTPLCRGHSDFLLFPPTRQLPVSLLPLSFLTGLITTIISTINSLCQCQLSRFQQIQNSCSYMVVKAPN